MSVDASLSMGFIANDRRTVGLNTGVNIAASYSPSWSFTDGAGALQANIVYQSSAALVAGVANIDLSGSLTDSYGTSILSARIKAFYFENRSASNIMTLGNATNPWITFLPSTSTAIIRPGGAIMVVAPDATGYAVTAATGDLFKVAGTGTDAFYFLFIGSST
jgi:hypothetical protein